MVGDSLSEAGTEAFYWTSLIGMQGLGYLDGGTYSRSYSVSADGMVIVGRSGSTLGNQAFRWTESEGLQGLGDIDGGHFSSLASDVSGDGSIIVGHGHSSVDSEAFRWTESEGMQGLGDLLGNPYSSNASAISGDGQVIIGGIKTYSNSGSSKPYVLDAHHGMRFIKDVLESDESIDLSGWELLYATDISADGSTIVGVGINPNGKREAWIAEIDPILNQPPLADAGPDQTSECAGPSGTLVMLDGSGSSDPNDEIIAFDWLEGELPLGSAETITYPFDLGPHNVTLEVTDSFGDTDYDDVMITIQDTIPPEISVSVSPDILWPPNHKMVHVTATVTATDNCDADPIIELVSIVMNESDEISTYDSNYDYSADDGQTSGDIQVLDDWNFYFRCERSGKSDGRIYTITYKVTDESGNESIADAEVIVPHSM